MTTIYNASNSKFQYERIREDSDDDGRNLCHDDDEESDRSADSVPPELGQVDSRQDADREGHQAGESDQHKGSLDRIRDASAAGGERQETPRDGRRSSDRGLEEDATSRTDGASHA